MTWCSGPGPCSSLIVISTWRRSSGCSPSGPTTRSPPRSGPTSSRTDHPLAADTLTLARFAGANHIIVSRRGRLRDPIDETLAGIGLRRRVVASAPTRTAALHIVSRSDLLVAVPERICAPMLTTFGLTTRPLPLDLPPVPLHLAWHQRYDNDKAHTWLRGLVRTALSGAR